MFVVFMSLHILFFIDECFGFYFASRSHAEFKFDLNSNWFLIWKNSLHLGMVFF
jgi:hypothetical protein